MGRYRSIKSGVILWRRSFKLLSWLTPIVYVGVAADAALDGFRKRETDGLQVAVMALVLGAAVYSLVRSRVHLTSTGILVVNCVFWREIPYSLLKKAEAGRGRGLAVYVKGALEQDAEVYSIGFAGSLIDQHFRTAERAAKVINKAKKKARRTQDVNPVVGRGIVRDMVVEISMAIAFVLAITSLFVGR
ncbi:hypothetical protein [Streptomyces nodosus]|uniref:PH domain-containing protein n=1 Tax=Streptomyces nodosus TaxID=40318 RepID=A0A0B5DRX1_9ACTN|nr:hypothetical protein [Streptomyces nodosus]AJE43341.1 hypothetical protein SNOD_27390 [Streptomyces nodosus]MBB4794773.1 hypothetical protein [Streptomyces nodosus]QEV41837.1 hypothetical protein CP978_27680 [Streptomyces nodosus]